VSAFGSLCFTDRGGGADGSATGLGVRASSDGVPPAAVRLVQEACLYEPPLTWITEGRPVADYPRSLAHAARDGWLATASGRYLGAELDGAGREGNHFTHAVCTEQLECYAHLRPAQLWRSPMWRDAAGPGATWSSVPAPPVPGPFDALTVQRWVAAQPAGEQTLLAVCSAVERVRAGGPRIVFVAADPEPVLAWIIASTLLLPRPDALTVGFKVFTRDATSGPHDIVAVHVDWASGYRVGAERGLVVFDLATGEHTAVAICAAAAFWVPRFLRRDCLDVLDAVELSGLCRADPTTDPGSAERVAAAALALAEPIAAADLDDVIGWASTSGGGHLPERRRRELLDRMLDAEPDVSQLRELASLAQRLREVDVRERIRWRVFGMESAVLRPQTASAADPADADAAVRAIVEWVDTAPPEAVPGLLTLADNYALQPDPGALAPALRRFARWWADGGLELPDRERWVCRALVDDLVRDELAARLETAPPSSQRALGDLWWRTLWQTVRDPRSRLDCTLSCATVLHGGPQEREGVTAKVLATLGAAPPSDALDVVWRALYARWSPSPEELVSVLDRLGAGLTPHPDTLRSVADALFGRPVSAAVLDVLGRLDAWGHTVARGTLAQTQWYVREIATMTASLAESDDDPERQSAAAINWADRLSGYPDQSLLDFAPGLVAALAGLRPVVAAFLIAQMDPEKRLHLVRQLRDRLGVDTDPRQIALAFAVSEALRDRDRGTARGMAKQLGQVARSLSDVDCGRVAVALDKAELERAWYDLNRSRWRRVMGAGT
jgi:GTPase-associated protein 1, N-terminal domain type 2/GTPase-associated protein 1, C-terminal domain/GTPase-associated protein 1, middle domain